MSLLYLKFIIYVLSDVVFYHKMQLTYKKHWKQTFYIHLNNSVYIQSMHS